MLVLACNLKNRETNPEKTAVSTETTQSLVTVEFSFTPTVKP